MSAQSPRYWALLPAAGVGARMRADRPKQYLPLLGKTVLEHTLARFLQHPMICGVVLALGAADRFWPTLSVQTDKPLLTVVGGAQRSETVLRALQFLQTQAAAQDWVLVHDAARPCLRAEDIDKLIHACRDDTVGGILAMPVRDTMKRAAADGRRIATTEEREGLWHALTPQMFRLQPLMQALQQASAAVTDEASAMEQNGLQPRLVEGRGDNIKITRAEDLALAEFFLKREYDSMTEKNGTAR